MRSKLGEDHPYTLTSMSNLALTYSALGQQDRALVLNEQTLKLRRSKLGEDHPDTLISMGNLASTYSALGQQDKALVLEEQTLKLSRSKLGEDHPDTLMSMSNLASTYSALGQQDRALVLNEQTLKLRRSKLGEDHPDTLTSMNNLAFTFSALGQQDKALVLSEQTLKFRRSKLGEDHPKTLTSMNNLAIQYFGLNQSKAAFDLVNEIILGAEKLRATNLSAENKQSLFAAYSDQYQLYSGWYAKQKRVNEGFDLADFSKARTLTDSIKGQAALASLPIGDRTKLTEAQSRLDRTRNTRDRLGEQIKAPPESLVSAQMQVELAQTELQQLTTDLKTRYPRYAQLIEVKQLKVSDAKGLLSPDEGFISYFVQANGVAQAYIVSSDAQPHWISLGSIPNLSATVSAYRELTSPSKAASTSGGLFALKSGGYQWVLAIELPPKDAVQVAASSTAALTILDKYLYDKFVKPVLPFASNYSRWIISPDKDLALLPFDNLPEDIDPSGSVGSTITQKRTITLVQSFAVFALLQQREAEYAKLVRSKDLFAMGNAVYGEGWAESRGMNRGKSQGAFRSGDPALLDSLRTGAGAGGLKEAGEQHAMRSLIWQNLPGTGREVSAVSSVFNVQGKNTVDALVGEDASESKLQELNRTGALKNYRYLLFSAHGYLAQNPALSALVLSQKGNPPDVDGYITASEWPLYDIRSDLTVLSACDTGVGKTQAGEGVMGLPYALFVAGNKNTLLSLWPVDDDATAEFMRTFFSKLKAGASQANALAETKRAFMRSPDWSDPRYWAAFVLYGV